MNTKNKKNNTVSTATTTVTTPALSGMSLDQLREALDNRTKEETEKARVKVEGLQAQLAEAVTELARFVPVVAHKSRKVGRKPKAEGTVANGAPRAARAKNDKPLNQVLHELLKGNGDFEMKTAIDMLEKTDFKTNAKNKYVLVFTALSTHPNMFKKIDRGTFRAI